jgi:hypothetical protein
LTTIVYHFTILINVIGLPLAQVVALLAEEGVIEPARYEENANAVDR